VRQLSRIAAWIQAYLGAWRSNHPDEIGSLFTERAEYFTSPYSPPWSGREAIVAGWLERRDAPGTWTFTHDVLIEDGALGVVRGETAYADGRTYSNLWLVWLDDDDRCTRFVEYYMLHG